MKDSSLASIYEVATSRKTFDENAQAPSCEHNFNNSILDDGFEHEDMQIIVSPYSCEHHHSGKEILGHEFGHAVSYIIGNTEGMSEETKKNHIKLRDCSGSETASIKKEVEIGDEFIPSFPGDYLTTEEDTADLLGFSLSDSKDHFVGCSLITDGTNYSNISINADDESPHSPAVVRLMLELQYKNPAKINAACAEVIKRSKSKINNKCF